MSHYDINAWLADQNVSNRIILAVFTSYNFETGEVSVYRLSNVAYTTPSTDYLLPNITFDPVLLGEVSKTYTADNSSATIDGITIANEEGHYDSLLYGEEIVKDQTISLYIGQKNWPFTKNTDTGNKFEKIFSGRIREVVFKDKEKLLLAINDEKKIKFCNFIIVK